MKYRQNNPGVVSRFSGVGTLSQMEGSGTDTTAGRRGSLTEASHPASPDFDWLAFRKYPCVLSGRSIVGNKKSMGPVPASDSDYPHYLYWMQFNNNLQSVLFIKVAVQATGIDLAADNVMMTTTLRREDGIYRALEERLGESDYLGGPGFSCADVMSMFNLTSLAMPGARAIDDSLPNTRAYVERVTARPAYQKAMKIAASGAVRPVR